MKIVKRKNSNNFVEHLVNLICQEQLIPGYCNNITISYDEEIVNEFKKFNFNIEDFTTIKNEHLLFVNRNGIIEIHDLASTELDSYRKNGCIVDKDIDVIFNFYEYKELFKYLKK